jgi:hypothetical protein
VIESLNHRVIDPLFDLGRCSLYAMQPHSYQQPMIR